MEFHPGRFVPRACHGNLWINWAPPIPLNVLDRGATGTAPRPQEHHTFKMLQKMLKHVRLDLQDQILSRRPKRAKLPDSTTGMSSVLCEMDKLLTLSKAPQEQLSEELDDAIRTASDEEASDAGVLGYSSGRSVHAESEDVDGHTSQMRMYVVEDERDVKLEKDNSSTDTQLQKQESCGASEAGSDAEELLFRGRNNL